MDRFVPEHVNFKGFILSGTSGPFLMRGGLHHASVRADPPPPETFAPTPFAAPPPFGGVLYQPVNPQNRFELTVITLGAEWRPGPWRLTAEYGQRMSHDTKVGPASRSGYITLARAFSNWTPYVTHARLHSPGEQRRLYEELNATPVPIGAQAPHSQFRRICTSSSRTQSRCSINTRR